MEKEFYQDRYNENKVWEVTRFTGGGFYVRQFVKGRQILRGIRTTKKFITSIGIFSFKKIDSIMPSK